MYPWLYLLYLLSVVSVVSVFVEVVDIVSDTGSRAYRDFLLGTTFAVALSDDKEASYAREEQS